MTDWIDTLDDATAGRVLAVYAGGRAADSQVRDCPPELRAALAAEFGPPAGERTGEGDLARAALRVLCEDPARARALRATAEQPARSFGALAAVGMAAAVLVVLQTHVKFDRDKQGKWSLKIEKKPASDKLLGKLADLAREFLSVLGYGDGAE